MKNKGLKMLLTAIIAFICFNNKAIYGISEDFKFIIDTIGIPRYNVYGHEINENIYKSYNVFSYGTPENLGSNVGQRWKDSKYGLWSKGNGARGEYNLLGEDYSGNIINNYYFPVDTLPDTTPEYWNYYSNPGAAESWNDKNKYRYVEQLEYMKNTKLMFNDISSRDNSDNPSKIKEYNITALRIGLNKARLDVCSTWKTNGIIHTRRKVGNQIRYAVFLTKPMAANADISSKIYVNKQDYVIKSNEEYIEIEIPYEARIINMTGYANEKHIKEINSKLYINGKEVSSISGSKISSLGKTYVLRLSRESLGNIKDNVYVIENRSFAHTEFAVDGLMQDSVKTSITLTVEKKEINPLNLKEIKILEKSDGKLVVSPLAQSNLSDDKESVGITEAGKNMVLKLKIDDDIILDEIKEIEMYIDDEKLNGIETIVGTSKRYLGIKFRIPVYINPTIYGWKSLRQIYGNYFSINEDEVGKRIDEAHMLKVKAKYNNKDYIKELKIDTIDDYITNINYSLNNAKLENFKQVELEKWIEN